jgi:uncharacterized membrane protein
MEFKHTYLILATILLVGLFLRLHQLDQESLWTDEVFTIHHASQENFEQLAVSVSKSEAVPFGHYFLLHHWIKLFGNSVSYTRFLSVIFGFLSISLIFILTRQLVNTEAALISSFLLSTSMLQVLYSQEVRLYALFTFLSLLSTYAFLRVYRSNHTKYLLYFLAILASIYTNYLTIFLIITFTFILFWNWQKTKHFFGKWLFLHLALFIFSIPLIPLLKTQYSSIGTGAAAIFVKLGVPHMIAQLGLFMFALPLVFLALFFLLILIFKTKFKQIQNYSASSPMIVFFLLLFSASYLYLCLNTLTIFKIPLFRVPIIHSYFLIRHSFFLVPIFYILLAKRLSAMSINWKALSLTIILLLNISALLIYYNEPTKAEWREAMAYIPDDSIILLDKAGFSNTFLLEYYAKPHRLVELTKVQRRSELLRIDLQEIVPLLDSQQEFWLVLSKNWETKDYYKNLFDQRYELKDSQEFYQIKVYRYHTKS